MKLALFVIYFLWCSVQLSISQDDFYELLGIDKSATTKDIRKAFKKVALVKHPDKNIVSNK